MHLRARKRVHLVDPKPAPSTTQHLQQVTLPTGALGLPPTTSTGVVASTITGPGTRGPAQSGLAYLW